MDSEKSESFGVFWGRLSLVCFFWSLVGCPGATTGSALSGDRSDQTRSAEPVMTRVDPAEVSEVVRSFEVLKRAGEIRNTGCDQANFPPQGKYSGSVGARVARSAMDLLGYEDQSRVPPDGLKCAKQASTILKRAGLEIAGSDSVVGLVSQLRKKGWCEAKRPIPGAVAFSNNEFKNGPRSHIGVVSYVSPQIEKKVQSGMTSELKERFSYLDSAANQSRSRLLTIYHNSSRWIVGYPQNKYDQEWFSKVKFLVPPESCERRSVR